MEDLVKGSYTGETVGSTKQILFQIANGLKYLHESYIVHCDIRPISIFISKPLRNSDDAPRIIIARFGQSIRKRKLTRKDIEDGISSDVTEPVDTTDPAACSWVEPDLLRYPDDYEFGFYTDIFSFGLVCGYTATGGEHPFGKTDEERKSNLVERNYNPSVFDSLDPCLLDLIERTIVFQTERRYERFNTILKFPFFWTDNEALDYLVTNFNDKINNKNDPTVMNSLEAIDESTRDQILNGNWKDYLQINYPKIYAHAVHSSFDGTKIFHLLRFIRNKVTFFLKNIYVVHTAIDYFLS